MQIPQRLLNGVRRDYMIGSLFEGVDLGCAQEQTGERQLLKFTLPVWQRPAVWDEAKKRAFVEGIFLGFGTGQYVINGSDWHEQEGKTQLMPFSGWLIDGQQRISALRDFVQGGMKLSQGLTYAAMSRPDQLRFLREPFPCFEMYYTADEQLLKTLYNRLNFGGVAHHADQVAV